MSSDLTLAKNDSESTVKRGLDPNEILGIYPNKWQRKFLAERWRHMSAEEQLVLRASRSKRGIKCYVCNSPGVFRENCPNGCQSPPATPRGAQDEESSDDEETKKEKEMAEEEMKEKLAKEKDEELREKSAASTVFWGAKTASHAKNNAPLTVYEMKKKLDFVELRVESNALKSSMRKSDKENEKMDFAFYEQAKESYARNAAELTLHQLMRRMMRLLEKELLQNADKLESKFDSTLLVPPFQRENKTFYPEEFLKNPEYREYFYNKTKNKGLKKAHQNQARLRPNDDLDALFRGESRSTDFLYKTKPNAGESIHAKNTWKSVYGKYDGLANSDPSLAAKQRKLDKIFHEQGQWIRLQKQNMEFRNDRFEHLVFILRKEMEKEHARETKVLLTDTSIHANAAKDSAVDVFQERLQAVDLMTHVLQTYKFIAGGEEADFLLYCMRQWQEIQQQKKILGTKKSQVRRVGKSSTSHRSHISSNLLQSNDKDGDNDSDSHEGSSSLLFLENETADDLSTTDQPNNAEDAEDADANFLQKLQQAETQKKQQQAHSKAKQLLQEQKKQRGGGGGGMRDLIAAENPYHHDIVFLETLKKKEARIFAQGKTGQVFTAQAQRVANAELEKKRNERTKALETMTFGTSDLTLTLPPSSDANTDDVPLNNNNHHHKHSRDTVSLPSLDEVLSLAKAHSERVAERDTRLHQQQLRLQERTKPPLSQAAHQHQHSFTHPRDLDNQRIAQRQAAFQHAELGTRIRKGHDDDHAHALPALIPIPQAFDGNSQSVSYTAQNIIFGLKKDMVLSDLGYTPQTVVPLYVRTTLVETEGTSQNGDPTQEELALDRRYSHYLGRPLIRFNNPANASDKPVKTVKRSLQIAGKAAVAPTCVVAGTQPRDEEPLEDLSALHALSSPYDW